MCDCPTERSYPNESVYWQFTPYTDDHRSNLKLRWRCTACLRHVMTCDVLDWGSSGPTPTPSDCPRVKYLKYRSKPSPGIYNEIFLASFSIRVFSCATPYMVATLAHITKTTKVHFSISTSCLVHSSLASLPFLGNGILPTKRKLWLWARHKSADRMISISPGCQAVQVELKSLNVKQYLPISSPCSCIAQYYPRTSNS